MPPGLADWPRTHYRQGGGDAFLFYVVFGPRSGVLTVSASHYRCDSVPRGIQVMNCETSAHPGVVESFREGYVWNEFAKFAPELAADVKQQTACVILRGSIPDPENLNYFRNVVGIITSLLDRGGITVYDPQMFKWWSPAEWRSCVFEPTAACPRHHVVILISEDTHNTEWFHTRGMRKFGRPDLSIHRVPSDLRDAVIDLCERFIEFQAFGGIVDEGEEIRMRSLPPGMTCSHRGCHDDPDFNNVHIEINWPDGVVV